jgi:hypothetical protein
MKPRDAKASGAFDVCHEIYAAARELVDTRLPTLQLATAGKFLWRPDLHPRLVEYVADFARAGERALAEPPPRAVPRRPPHKSRELRASRLILFRMYYLGGAEYHAARRQLGISELTWSDWTEEIRTRVGRELMRAGIFPPGRYFREMSARREGASDVTASAGRARAACEGEICIEP